MELTIKNHSLLKSLSDKKIMLILLLLAFIISFCPLPSVSAATDGDNSMPLSMMKTICSGISESISDALKKDSPIYTACIGDDAEIMQATKTFRDVLKTIAVFWVCSIAMIRCIHNIDQGKDPFSCVIKILIEIGIVGLFIIYSDKIASLCVELGIGLVDEAATAGFNPESRKVDINLGDSGVANSIEKIFDIIIGSKAGQYVFNGMMQSNLRVAYVMSTISQLLAKFLVYQVLIEVGIRRIFTPLAVADVYGEGLRSPGVRYLKKFVACFLKLIIAMAAGWVAGAAVQRVADSILSLDITSGITAIPEQINKIEGGFAQINALSFCVLGMIFKGGQLADEIVGA